MGLDVPDLDDRTYEELLEDARKRIPVHAESWTDHNAHDPGVTILELLAWLAESHAYQLDRVADAHRRKYLGLVDVEPRPPRPATVELSLSIPAILDGTEVGAGTEFVAETPAGRRERFRATDAVALSETRVATVVVDREGSRTDHARANEHDGLHFRAFGEDPSAGDAMYLGFEGDPFESPTLDLWIDFQEGDLPEPAEHGDEPTDFEPSLRCVWEHCVRPDDWYADDAWRPVEPERDETNALYRGGRVTLRRPSGWVGETSSRIAEHGDDRYWLRCRLAALDSRDAPEPRYEVPPQLNSVEVNVVRAAHEIPVEGSTLSTPDGRESTTAEPNQRFALGESPVQSAAVTVGGQPWETVSDFAGAGADDAVAVLDEAGGTVTFGDGRRGRIPEPGLTVEADYVAGGGPAGDLPADATWTFPDHDPDEFPDDVALTFPPDVALADALAALDDVAVAPRAPPSGGREAESIESALARARAQRRVPFRAVTAEDHAYIATHTPGLRFGRAAVAATRDERDPVTVVVVPYSPDGRLPVPSSGFREAVERHLCSHALLTERVRVVGPRYVPVDVRAEIEPVAGSDREAVVRAARDEIAAFLDPLDGFEGEGWPFGRPIYRSELYERLETMERVADAVDVGVSVRGDVAMGDREDTLPSLASVDVDVHDEGRRCRRDP